MTPPRFVLRLAKEDFKFSVAHFTVFSDTVAEELHGHNYRVRVEIAGAGTDAHGLLMDLRGVKAEIRRLCGELDSKTLLPERSTLVRVTAVDGGYEVRYGERLYRLPAADVRLLPIRNTSIEELAAWFWRMLRPSLDGSAITELRVEVEETAGQSCVYSASLADGGARRDVERRGPYHGSMHRSIDARCSRSCSVAAAGGPRRRRRRRSTPRRSCSHRSSKASCRSG